MAVITKKLSRAIVRETRDLINLKQRKTIPHEFVLERLAPASPRTRSMFGCLAVYVGNKIVLALRDKQDKTADNGIWLATTVQHHESLRREFPRMRSIQVFGKEVSAWQLLPADSLDFEEAALRACELILNGDPRIGRVPQPRGAKTKKRGPVAERAAIRN